MKRIDATPEQFAEATRFLSAHLDVLRGLQNAAAERAEKYLLLTNAGAVVATLSFIGVSAAMRERPAVWLALSFFVTGVVLCGVLAAFNFHGSSLNFLHWIRDSDRFYQNELDLKEVTSGLNRRIQRWKWIAPTAGYMAFISLVVGSATAIHAVSIASIGATSMVATPAYPPVVASPKEVVPPTKVVISTGVGAPEPQPTVVTQPTSFDMHGRSEQSPLVVRVLPSVQSPTDAAREAKERNEKQRLDRQLVDFNGDLAYYTKILALVAALQFGALVGQVVFLRLAFGEARRAGDIARDAMIAGERAFVFALGVRGLWEMDAVTNTYHWRFRPVWKNSGDTPTRNMTMHSECEVRQSPLPAGFNFGYPTSQTGKALIPPSTEVLGGVAPMAPKPAISPQDIIDAQQGKKMIFMWGWARYSDVFPGTPEHLTRFCWIVTPMGDPMAFNPKQPNGIEFQTIHHFEGNCADDECLATG